jgi:GDP-L-fucose synthase
MVNKNYKIFLAGHKGHLGSAIYKKLKKAGFKNVITINKSKLNLLNQEKVFKFLKKNKPKVVIIAAARVGGIHANNTQRAKFIYENLTIQNNIIHGSYLSDIKNLIFFGSSCIYPKNISKPITEKMLLTGKLEYTNEPYAIAKIAGVKLCENYNLQYKTNYKCLMPCNSYGPNDNYDLKNSHFIAALIKKIYLAKKYKRKQIEIWGTGKPKREIIFVDDIADACIYFMNKKTKKSLINIGTGKDLSIEEYAKYLIKFFNLNLKIKKNLNMPDGIKRKLLNVSLANSLGWKAQTSLKNGLTITLQDINKKNLF